MDFTEVQTFTKTIYSCYGSGFWSVARVRVMTNKENIFFLICENKWIWACDALAADSIAS